MRVNPVEVLRLEVLRTNPDNPKRPLGLKYRRGLRASLDRFGFAGLFVVAANEDGTFEVLDGNTRLDELAKAGVESVPCVVYRGMPPAERRQFVLAHDRHRKVFDEEAVAAQLEALAGGGADLKQLELLSGKDNLARLLAESQGRAAAGPQAPAAGTPAPPAMASLVLYGPAAEAEAIRGLLKQVRGRLSTLERARKALAQAADFLDWSDERLLAVLLATISRFGEGVDAGS